MLLIYLGYALLLSGPLRKSQEAKVDSIGQGLHNSGQSMDMAIRQLDTAVLRLEAGRLWMLGDPDATDSLMLRTLDSTMASLRDLRVRMSLRKDTLDSLRRRADALR